MKNKIQIVHPCGHVARFCVVFTLIFYNARRRIFFVADFVNGTIEKFTPGGSESLFASGGLDGPMGLAFDNAGNLVCRKLEQTTQSSNMTRNGQLQLVRHCGIEQIREDWTCDASGNLYVANYNGNDVIEFSPNAKARCLPRDQPTHRPGLRCACEIFMLPIGTMTFLSFYPTVFPHFLRPPAIMVRAPEVLRSTAAGNLYVANYWNNAIYKFDSNGNGGILPARFRL